MTGRNDWLDQTIAGAKIRHEAYLGLQLALATNRDNETARRAAWRAYDRIISASLKIQRELDANIV